MNDKTIKELIITDQKLNKKYRIDTDKTNNVIDIEANLSHNVTEFICVKCGKRWIGVYPSSTLLKDLECENCGKGYVIKTGQELEWR